MCRNKNCEEVCIFTKQFSIRMASQKSYLIHAFYFNKLHNWNNGKIQIFKNIIYKYKTLYGVFQYSCYKVSDEIDYINKTEITCY